MFLMLYCHGSILENTKQPEDDKDRYKRGKASHTCERDVGKVVGDKTRREVLYWHNFFSNTSQHS